MNEQTHFPLEDMRCHFCVRPATVFWFGEPVFGFCRDHEPTADWMPGDTPVYLDKGE